MELLGYGKGNEDNSGPGRKKGYREHNLTHLVSDGHHQARIIVSAIGLQLSNHVTSVVERGRVIV